MHESFGIWHNVAKLFSDMTTTTIITAATPIRIKEDGHRRQIVYPLQILWLRSQYCLCRGNSHHVRARTASLAEDSNNLGMSPSRREFEREENESTWGDVSGSPSKIRRRHTRSCCAISTFTHSIRDKRMTKTMHTYTWMKQKQDRPIYLHPHIDDASPASTHQECVRKARGVIGKVEIARSELRAQSRSEQSRIPKNFQYEYWMYSECVNVKY